ncbi:hypothetical protein Clacol_007392 [Clathrus columnatus]|uniref:AB hydrolase-1 domain-containing protein n=1 Tax=Clathrus columnatus TaxID=1419009 RepID=A0AAV5AEU2_9AGAM|nr:hypothetical protein Clacol_007392 [Clathrus columnatus]
MLPLAHKHDAYVVAPDLRGYGRTTGWDASDTSSFRMFNLVTDVITLVYSLGYNVVECLIGHDFGSRVGAYCALVRPDLFTSTVIMSAPFPGPVSFPPSPSGPNVSQTLSELQQLTPPRKHYAQYFSDPSLVANKDMMSPPQGLHSFFLGYFHMKSADWPGNEPRPLQGWSASELAKLPDYYVMPADKSMPQVVLSSTPSVIPSWLTDEELDVFVAEYTRTTFQGGLNYYNYRILPQPELFAFMNKRVDVPVLFIAGEKDWGMYQAPGEINRMRIACTKMAPGDEGCKVVKGAGHWVQQENPEEVVHIISDFLSKL